MHLEKLVAQCAPTLMIRRDIGTQRAAQLLITAGQNIELLKTDESFSQLRRDPPAPIPSGKANRMRLHRGGDSNGNKTLHLIVVARIRTDARTMFYME